MIYYWLHILYVYLGAKLFWQKSDLEADFSRIRRVSILDCDALRFMANAKYFYYMDFIRLELLFRTKLYDNTFKKGIYPVLGSQKIIYKKPLKRWSKFKVSLILEGWDDKWVYHKQVFSWGDEIHAIGITKVAFWKKKEVQDMRKILANSGVVKTEMNPSKEILDLFKDDSGILKSSEIANP